MAARKKAASKKKAKAAPKKAAPKPTPKKDDLATLQERQVLAVERIADTLDRIDVKLEVLTMEPRPVTATEYDLPEDCGDRPDDFVQDVPSALPEEKPLTLAEFKKKIENYVADTPRGRDLVWKEVKDLGIKNPGAVKPADRAAFLVRLDAIAQETA